MHEQYHLKKGARGLRPVRKRYLRFLNNLKRTLMKLFSVILYDNCSDFMEYWFTQLSMVAITIHLFR